MNSNNYKSITLADILNEIIVQKKESDPFYIVDINQIFNYHQRWMNNLPNIKPFYAVKSNNDIVLLEILNELRINFDCASLEEIKQVLSLNVDPSKIIYAHPCKPISHLKYASEVGVDLMTFDCIEELFKIKENHSSPKLVLRIYVDDTKSVFKLGQKFGTHKDDIEGLLSKAKELELNVVGVSFHVGSGSSDASSYYNALECARYAFDVGKALGYSFYLLDIGGGFPSFKKHGVEFEDSCGFIKKGLDTFFKDMKDLQIIAEPGQFYSTAAFNLVTNVIARKTQKDSKRMYYINNSLFNMTNIIYEPDSIFYPDFYLKRENSYKIQTKEFLEKHDTIFYESKIWGPTCDSTDIISSSIKLPDLTLDDWLIYPQMGSYTTVLSSNFNSFPKPKHYYAKIINF
jgi:ornithine decarboxylase